LFHSADTLIKPVLDLSSTNISANSTNQSSDCQRKGTSHVANIKSQKKRILTNAKAADRNKAVKSELRTRVKTAVKNAGAENSEESLRVAVKRLDMAAAKGIIHPNQAARRKSRLMKRVNAGA
jgi:small subunit ribosomal protein S20